jgi:hypothetical protein
VHASLEQAIQDGLGQLKHCKPGVPLLPYNPNIQGGGSDSDWDVARTRGVDVYSISPERIWRLPKNTPQSVNEWNNNSNGYDLGTSGSWNSTTGYDVGTKACPWLPKSGTP